MEMPVALTKTAVRLSSSRLPYSLSLRSLRSGHVSRLIASCSRQCCSRCSAVMMSALHGHISDLPTLNLLYTWALSLLCPVLNLNRITCSVLFSLWRLSDWLSFGCCCFHFFLGEGFDDGLFISIGGISVLLFQLASLPGKPVCLLISLDSAWSLVNMGCLSLQWPVLSLTVIPWFSLGRR